jgi:hypothetical protein
MPTLQKKGATVSDEDENVQPCDEDDLESNRDDLVHKSNIVRPTRATVKRTEETSRERAHRLREQFYEKQQAKMIGARGFG